MGKGTKFIVGLFVLGGTAMAAALLIFLGATHVLQKGKYYVTYFDESVQGLMKDSPVKYRGVPIGRVNDIRIAPDGRLIEVVLKIDPHMRLGPRTTAQLKAIGITGTVFVELDRRGESEPDLSPSITFPAPYPVIGSKPSETKILLSGVTEVLKNLETLDLKGVMGKMTELLDTVNSKVADVDLKGLSEETKKAVKDIDKIAASQQWDKTIRSIAASARSIREASKAAEVLLKRLNMAAKDVRGILAENRQPLKEAMAQLKTSIKSANGLMKEVNAVSSRTDARMEGMYQRLQSLAEQLGAVAESAQRLLDLISEQPSLLLFSKPKASTFSKQRPEK